MDYVYPYISMRGGRVVAILRSRATRVDDVASKILRANEGAREN